MNTEYQNAWKTARESAGLTQEAAAELVDVSVKSISYYESGARHITPQIAAQLADAYRAPWLRNLYCKECPIGCHRNLPTEPTDLRTASIDAQCELRAEEIGRRIDRLMEIARDGKVDVNEMRDFEMICARFREMQHALAKFELLVDMLRK